MNYKAIIIVILQSIMTIGVSAQVKTELFHDKSLAETTPTKLPVIAQLELFEGIPQLQSKISEFFFNEKSESIKVAFQHYLETLKGKSIINPDDPKEKVAGRLFELHKVFEKKGVFVCFEANYTEMQTYAGNKSVNARSICVTYDLMHHKLLTLDDIFIPSTAKFLKGKLDKGEVSFIVIDFGETNNVSNSLKDIISARMHKGGIPALHYGNRYQVQHMEFQDNRKHFTASFNELVDALLD